MKKLKSIKARCRHIRGEAVKNIKEIDRYRLIKIILIVIAISLRFIVPGTRIISIGSLKNLHTIDPEGCHRAVLDRDLELCGFSQN